jgi:hypothetical protein
MEGGLIVMVLREGGVFSSYLLLRPLSAQKAELGIDCLLSWSEEIGGVRRRTSPLWASNVDLSSDRQPTKPTQNLVEFSYSCSAW